MIKTMRVLLLLLTTSLTSPALLADYPPITVMGYNLMQLPVQDWDQTQRINHLPAALRSLGSLPDAIGYSEVFTDEAYNTIVAMAEYPYHTPIVGKTCSGGGWDSISGDCSSWFTVIRGGVMIASQHPIVRQHALVFSHYSEGSWDAMSNKGAVYAEITVQGQPVHLVATHLQATHDGGNDAEHTVRMQQLSEMKAWLDGFDIPANEPLILTGDMNVPFSRSAQIADMLSVTNTRMNFDATTEPASYPEANWMARASNYHFEHNMCYRDTLDYVMWRADHLQPENTPEIRVIPLQSLTAWYWDYLEGDWSLCAGDQYHNGYTRDISDHYPVVTTFDF